jgi:ribonuclease R
MSFDPNGDMLSHRISRSYIQSAKRFSYEEAKEVLDGKKKSPHLNLLNQMVELCHLLKKKRSDRGSIDFALPELIIVINDKGEPTGTKIVHYDITHQLVEEFMLKANEIVAKHLADHDKPVVFRVHESPRPDSMEEFYALARHLGFSLPDEPSTDDLQKLFKKAKSTTFGQQLSVGFIRSMKLAIYSPENVGHFGLALEHYCHFTSPIRRYTDLIIQRLLFDENDPSADIAQIAQHSSEQERISMRAENSVKLLKKLRLLDEWTKKDPKKTYQATVTKVKPFGLTFEVPDLTLEGFLHISELENDYFVYNPHQNILLGRSSGKTHRAGEVITVLPTLIDLIFLDAKWELVTPKSSRRRKK